VTLLVASDSIPVKITRVPQASILVDNYGQQLTYFVTCYEENVCQTCSMSVVNIQAGASGFIADSKLAFKNW
jgi:hypothetical protein